MKDYVFAVYVILTQPKIYGGRGKLIFPDLYVYTFVAFRNLSAYMSAHCLLNSNKSKTIDLFSRVNASKRSFFLDFRAQARENV